MKHGKFVISLDLELLWGVRDKKTIATYGDNIKAVHQVIPRSLEAFAVAKVKATFATVGLLFFETKEDLITGLPANKPAYNNKNLSPYNGYLDQVGNSYQDDLYHYAPHLIKLIQQYPEQEIGSHTFSHYYCLEGGQTPATFRDDLICAKKIADQYGIQLTSLVFPRNQYNHEYLNICREQGIIVIRGNEHSWLYKARNQEEETRLRRAFRLMDAYVNISGHNCYNDHFLKSSLPTDIPASRFLRPYNKKLKMLEGLRLRRILSDMSYAAKTNSCFHLWWHPHNFGKDQEENFKFLERILKHYLLLNAEYGFTSYTMTELAKAVSKL